MTDEEVKALRFHAGRLLNEHRTWSWRQIMAEAVRLVREKRKDTEQ